MDHRRTGLPKKGRHSVGVGRQYCGQLGKQDNCQVAVSLSIANHHASLPVAYRCICRQTGPRTANSAQGGSAEEISFKTKPEIALEQLRWACAANLPRGVVLMDRGMAATRACAWHQRLACAMWPASCRRPACGRRVRDRCRRRSGRAAGDIRSSFAATTSINPSRSGTCARLAQARLAYDRVAGGYGGMAVLALCARARSCRAS